MNNELLSKAKNIFFIALAIDLLASIINGFNSYSSLNFLREVQQGLIQIDQSIIDKLDSRDIFSKITILISIGCSITFILWLKASYKFARTELGATGFKYEGWIIAGWIVPIWNLFRPYQIINEIYKVGSPNYSEGDNWRNESGSGVLLSWRIFWIFTSLVVIIMANEIMSHNSIDNSISRLINSLNFDIGFTLLSAVNFICCYVIAKNLTQRLLNRSLKFSNKPDRNVGETQPPQQAIARPVITNDAPIKTHSIAPVAPPAPTPSAIPSTSIPSAVQPTASSINMENIEDQFYEAVANELEAGTMQKGLWTKLYAQCGGDEVQTKVRYIEQRVAQLVEAEKQRYKDAQQVERSRQESATREQQKIDAAKSALGIEQYLFSERNRLIKLLLPHIYSVITKVESHIKFNPYGQNDEPSMNFIRLLGGRVIQNKGWLGDVSYLVELNGKSLDFPNGHTFNSWITEVLIPKIKSAEDFPLEKLQKMECYGITFDGKKYHYKAYQYDNFSDALNYAEQQVTK